MNFLDFYKNWIYNYKENWVIIHKFYIFCAIFSHFINFNKGSSEVQKKFTAVLDFGSSKLFLCLGRKGVNGTFAIRCLTETKYAGFNEGEFLEPEKLYDAVKQAIQSGEIGNKQKITTLYVGVPAEFCMVECKEITKHFANKIKLTKENIDEISKLAINKDLLKDKTLISCSPNWVKLDDERKVLDYECEKTTKITTEICSIYAENYFIKAVNSILAKIGIESVEYICASEAQAKYLLSDEERTRENIIIDVGYISSSVMCACGRGITNLKTFSLGGAHVSADLAECLDITFEQGEALKREIVLSINSKKSEDCYEVNVKNKVLPVPINFANEVVKARLDMMCQLIKKIINNFGVENSQFVTVYLTGGGLSYIKGSRDYLAKSIGRNVQLLVPSMPELAKPHLSSVLSVLNSALKCQEKSKLTLHNIFKR